jgi:4-amino-4-deoxy-L-arabinose transferase-like glycosyltransferase
MLMRWSETVWLSLILVLYLVLGSLYAVYTPAWQAPDEPAHYNYVRYLAEQGSLPVLQPGDYPHAYLEQIKAAHFPEAMSIAPLRYEFWQPPLYYLLAVPAYRLSGGSLLAMRLFSVLLGACVAWAAYGVVRAMRPSDGGLALGTAAFVAFVPMHLAINASVNNDVLAELLIVVIALRVAGWLSAGATGESSWRSDVLTGVLLGLGLLTKLTVYYTALPLLVLGLWLHERCPARFIRRVMQTMLPALLLALPWYARNVAVYGWPDLLGKLNHDNVVVGQLRTAEYLAQVGWAAYLRDMAVTTFHSFWGQFGWMAVPMDERTYFVLGLLSALAVVGIVLAVWTKWHSGPVGRLSIAATGNVATDTRQVRKPALPASAEDLVQPPMAATGNVAADTRQAWVPALLGAWLMLALGGYLSYNVTFVQFQGRYLFPGLVPIGLLMVVGWRTILARRRAFLGAGACVVVTAAEAVGRISGGSLDRWALALGGGSAFLFAVRRWVPAAFDALVWVLPLIVLAALSAYSLFGFVVPNL